MQQQSIPSSAGSATQPYPSSSHSQQPPRHPEEGTKTLSHSALQTHTGSQEKDVVPVLPPDGSTAFDMCNPVVQAAQEAEELTNSTIAKMHPNKFSAFVDIAYDEDLEFEAVDVLGKDAKLKLSTKCTLPYLVLQINDLDKFCSIELTLVDTKRRIRRITMSNKQTTTRVQDDACSMPLVLVKGWNYVNLDLPDISKHAFGVDHKYCKSVIIHGSLRVGRVYFQKEVFDDSQLPEFLRVAH
eukprot:gb/GECG01007266.1/.p1 GENE.gb/GECG01007266.1/~~gb/GECG01007266.1/.p1  ORF type:complete len:241 (+),score=33.45 gb/GECG01007266.1/:1-723(+)